MSTPSVAPGRHLIGGSVAVIRPLALCVLGPERAKAVASVPYDVVNTEEARALAAGNPLSFLHCFASRN